MSDSSRSGDWGRRVEPELLEECADWIAEQIGEEGLFVDAGLVQLMLEHEYALDQRIPSISAQTAATQIVASLNAAGVQGAPEPVDEPLVLRVLGWEDDFLSLAGRGRSGLARGEG